MRETIEFCLEDAKDEYIERDAKNPVISDKNDLDRGMHFHRQYEAFLFNYSEWIGQANQVLQGSHVAVELATVRALPTTDVLLWYTVPFKLLEIG
ncbi:hypothetical protein KXD40_003752 [Peronospora effusa]|uniref:Uncharacterized protein n=1 Tax=Peronospora effusa TaxID=542832 RepID=A0A3M6V8Z6_9STRA|nr:hypothetical protein DD238_006744 [Peronospora effusa]UIZ23237.1 hypothetical protein KXD40_003752 [Peronospora effusa]